MLGEVPIRILVIGLNHAPERTGIAPYTSGMATRLAAEGHHVRVLTTFPHYPEWRFTDGTGKRTQRTVEDGVEVVRMRHRLPSRRSSLSRVLSELSFGMRALVAGWGRPQVVVLVSPALFASALISVRARLTGRPLAVWVQDLYGPGVREMGTGDRFGLAERVVSRVEAGLLRRADSLAVIHEHMVDAAESLGVDRARVSVIRNWSHVGLESHKSRIGMRAQLGWQQDEVVVLHTGNMGVKQDLGNVIAAARVAEERGLPVRFVLMGDGQMRPALERAAAGVDQLQMVDPLPQSQYLDALRAADILLVNEQASLRLTALPSKLTSYFASGRPVLVATAADSLAAAEVAAAGGGERVPPADPAALVNAVGRLAGDPLLSFRLAENGRSYLADHLTLDAAVRSFTVMLGRATSRPGGHSSRRPPMRPLVRETRI